MPTFAQLCDIHVGQEVIYDLNTSKFIKKPTHDLKFFNKVLEFLKFLKPDVVILGGGQLDQFGVSRFNKDSKIAQVEELLELKPLDLCTNNYVKILACVAWVYLIM